MEAETIIVDKIEAIKVEDNKDNENVDETLESGNKKSQKVSEVLANETLSKIYPRLMRIKPQLKELIFKQNKIYLNISAEKFKYTDNNIYVIENLMERVKFYREKLVRIRRTIIEIHHKSKSLKNRAINLQKYAENQRLNK